MTHIFALQFVQTHIVPSHHRFHECNSGSQGIPFRAIKSMLFSYCILTLQVPSKALKRERVSTPDQIIGGN